MNWFKTLKSSVSRNDLNCMTTVGIFISGVEDGESRVRGLSSVAANGGFFHRIIPIEKLEFTKCYV